MRWEEVPHSLRPSFSERKDTDVSLATSSSTAMNSESHERPWQQELFDPVVQSEEGSLTDSESHYSVLHKKSVEESHFNKLWKKCPGSSQQQQFYGSSTPTTTPPISRSVSFSKNAPLAKSIATSHPYPRQGGDGGVAGPVEFTIIPSKAFKRRSLPAPAIRPLHAAPSELFEFPAPSQFDFMDSSPYDVAQPRHRIASTPSKIGLANLDGFASSYNSSSPLSRSKEIALNNTELRGRRKTSLPSAHDATASKSSVSPTPTSEAPQMTSQVVIPSKKESLSLSHPLPAEVELRTKRTLMRRRTLQVPDPHAELDWAGKPRPSEPVLDLGPTAQMSSVARPQQNPRSSPPSMSIPKSIPRSVGPELTSASHIPAVHPPASTIKKPIQKSSSAGFRPDRSSPGRRLPSQSSSRTEHPQSIPSKESKSQDTPVGCLHLPRRSSAAASGSHAGSTKDAATRLPNATKEYKGSFEKFPGMEQRSHRKYGAISATKVDQDTTSHTTCATKTLQSQPQQLRLSTSHQAGPPRDGPPSNAAAYMWASSTAQNSPKEGDPAALGRANQDLDNLSCSSLRKSRLPISVPRPPPSCLDPILALPPAARDLHYRAHPPRLGISSSPPSSIPSQTSVETSRQAVGPGRKCTPSTNVLSDSDMQTKPSPSALTVSPSQDDLAHHQDHHVPTTMPQEVPKDQGNAAVRQGNTTIHGHSPRRRYAFVSGPLLPQDCSDILAS